MSAPSRVDDPRTIPSGDPKDLGSAKIGERVRALRKERGWTLQELGRRSDVSFSALSKIENAQVTPTFDTLLKIAHGLGLGFEALMSQGSIPEAVMPSRGGGRLTITREVDAASFSTSMYEYRVHANGLRRKYMTPLIMEVKARRATEVTDWSSHEGEEFIYVIKGRIELHTEFYEPVSLDVGDSAYIDSAMAHMFLNAGPGEALMASICYSPSADRPGLINVGVNRPGIAGGRFT